MHTGFTTAQIEVETRLAGSSTPSTAASPNPHAGPPHDAEAVREQERLEAAKHLEFLSMVREWADGVDVVDVRLGRVQSLIDDLTHEVRQAVASQHFVTADVKKELLGRLQWALR